MFKKKKQASSAKKEFFYFAIKGEFNKEDIKTLGIKPISEIITNDDATYVLYVKKKYKIAHSQEINLFLIDMTSSNFSNCIATTKNEYVFISKNKTKEHLYEIVKTIPKDDSINDEILESLAGSFFNGEAYRYTQDSIKDLKTLYQKQDPKIIIVILLFMALIGVSIYIYIDMTKPKVHKKIKPPRPHIPQLQMSDLWIMKSFLDKKAIDTIVKYSEEIEKGDKFNNPDVKRISSFKVGDFEKLSFSGISFNTEDNRWEFNEPQLKRGGLGVTYKVTYQKTIPDVGYKYFIQQNGFDLYQKSISHTEYFYGIDLNSTSRPKPFTTKCMKQIVDLAPNIKINERTDKLLDISFNDSKAGAGLVKIQKMLKECPIYFDDITMLRNKISGHLIAYREDFEL